MWYYENTRRYHLRVDMLNIAVITFAVGFLSNLCIYVGIAHMPKTSIESSLSPELSEMPLRGCSSGLLATALVIFLVVPIQYYVPDLYLEPKDVLLTDKLNTATPASTDHYNWISLEHFPPFDLFLTISLLILALVTHLCDWIQRKLMERRIVKLNKYLTESVVRLRAWDARQEQLEATLRMVQNATSEYNLLLYLLLRQRRKLGTHKAPPSHCFFDKEFDDLNFIRNPTIDA